MRPVALHTRTGIDVESGFWLYGADRSASTPTEQESFMDLKFLDFEQPIAELEAKIDELRFVGDDSEININDAWRALCPDPRPIARSVSRMTCLVPSIKSPAASSSKARTPFGRGSPSARPNPGERRWRSSRAIPSRRTSWALSPSCRTTSPWRGTASPTPLPPMKRMLKRVITWRWFWKRWEDSTRRNGITPYSWRPRRRNTATCSLPSGKNSDVEIGLDRVYSTSL